MNQQFGGNLTPLPPLSPRLTRRPLSSLPFSKNHRNSLFNANHSSSLENVHIHH